MVRLPDALALGGLLAPWAIVALVLPMPERLGVWALLLALGMLAILATAWSRHRARHHGLDEDRWALAAAMTLGLSSIMLMGRPAPSMGATFLCRDCGRLGSVHEPFCFGCGG